jgi:bifunctional UDP-N-acetylglucosamine pyrophosphorylase / glucosamine-1-phosphate N-acetyltransferase
MKSTALPKVLHSFAGRSLVGHVLAATADLNATTTAVVIGHRRDEVAAHLATVAPEAVPVVQAEQNGTGHAVRVALEQVHPNAADDYGTVLVLPGDAPLLRAETLAALLADHHASGATATLLTSDVADPTGYGRVIRDSDSEAVERVVEQKDANPDELAVTEVSALVYAFNAALLRDAVGRLSTNNVQGEEYLPEVVTIFVNEGRSVRAVKAAAEEVLDNNCHYVPCIILLFSEQIGPLTPSSSWTFVGTGPLRPLRLAVVVARPTAFYDLS